MKNWQVNKNCSIDLKIVKNRRILELACKICLSMIKILEFRTTLNF